MDERQVFEAADALRDEGKLVSVRSVRVGLGRKGSYRDIGRLVSRWKTDRHYTPRVEVKGVPVSLQNTHGKALSELWDAARILASGELEKERKRLRSVALASEEVRDEALQELDRLMDEVTELKAEVSRLRGLLDRRGAHVERMKSEEFWSRLMQEVRDLLPSQGSMTVEEILPRIRDSAWRETASHGEQLTASILRKKMHTRARHGKFFSARDDGSFERRDGVGRRAGPVGA